MISWIDLLLLDSEEALGDAIYKASPPERESLIRDLLELLSSTRQATELATLRILLERARPLALPVAVWRRRLDETWSVQDAARTHLEELGLEATGDRLRAMQALYARFKEERTDFTARDLGSILGRQSYACIVCGLRFYNQDLTFTGLESPRGNRVRVKSDPLKPHWSNEKLRRPNIEHMWPISMFGDNSTENMVVACRGCNQGKDDYMSPHQTRALVGLVPKESMAPRARLTCVGAVAVEMFYAQMLRQPSCQSSGKTWRDCELTVALRDAKYPQVVDNLITVEAEAE